MYDHEAEKVADAVKKGRPRHAERSATSAQEAVLGLQQAIGNDAIVQHGFPGAMRRGPDVQRVVAGATPAGPGRAPKPAVPVQRYYDVSPGDEGYPSKHKRSRGVTRPAPDDEKFFVSQEERGGSFFAGTAPPEANLVRMPGVPLRISNNLDLAIENTGREAKYFFATEEHVAKANAALTGEVELRTTARKLQIAGERGVVLLYQVEPVQRTARGKKLGPLTEPKSRGLAMLTPQRCNEMADFVSGKRDPASRGITAWEDFLGVVLDRVFPGETNQRTMSELHTRLENEFTPGNKEAYLGFSQTMSGRFQELQRTESPELEQVLRDLGLNRFLPPPKPGDVLMTVGYGTEEQEKNRDKDNTFAYHLGTPIAVSGDDYITMENYARRDPAVTSTGTSGDPLYFFRMYGSEESAETWHDVQLGTGGFLGAILSIKLS